MASRRTRIKGIANIPQRRKNTSTNDEHFEPQEQVETSQGNTNLTFDKKAGDSQDPQVAKLDDSLGSEKNNSNTSNESVEQSAEIVFNDPSLVEFSGDDKTEVQTNNKNAETEPNNQQINETNEPETAKKEPEIRKVEEPKIELTKKPLLMRRKFIKPAVSAGVINRKTKQVAEKETAYKTEPLKEKDSKREVRDSAKSDNIVISPKNVDSSKQNEVTARECKVKQPTPATVLDNGNEGTLDEVHLTPQNGVMLKPEGPIDNAKKLTHYIINTHNSDTEYPPPPPSPSKINRSRIKAIPRLGYRKTSFSASESEDESRKNYNRNRNDSVCSTASGAPETITECMSPQRPAKELNTIIQKKCSRTEQSRKLAEARREFQRRFGANKPDRQRLTMIDLIFYNPTSNPMTNDTKMKVDMIKKAEDITIEDEESEKVDDPLAEPEPAAKSDEENEMPVPQIKIGPSGEIILDEKSLVIESKEVIKQREELQKTQLVDGDFDTGYGVYKRQKKAKDWSHSETLRFYKALNTIGTDFSLMCELFPRRNRRELKMKFKKEEKINRALIDRAVMQPCRFDYVELKHEVDMEEKELKELQKQKEEELKLKKEKMERIRKRKASKEMKMENMEKPVNVLPPKPPKIRKVRKPRVKKLSIETVLAESDADESDIGTQSESDEKIMPLKPTRSGRIPKATKKLAESDADESDIGTQNESEEKIALPLKRARSGRIPKVPKKFNTTEPHSVQSIIKESKVSADTKTNDIEPGSIMIITERGQNGEPVYKLFMVTPDKNATPLKLTSDVVSKALAFKKGVSAQNIMTISANVTDDEGDYKENNITIPADENVTTMKEGAVIKPEESNDGLVETSTRSAEENVVSKTECLLEGGGS